MCCCNETPDNYKRDRYAAETIEEAIIQAGQASETLSTALSALEVQRKYHRASADLRKAHVELSTACIEIVRAISLLDQGINSGDWL